MAHLGKWLSCVVRSYLYGPFHCMFLWCHVPILEWIHTLQLPECWGTLWAKQARFLKSRWLQRDSNPKPLRWNTNTQPFRQTDQMIELCCEQFSVWCIWLYVAIMSRTNFRVNPHSILAWSSRNSLLGAGTILEV